MSRKLLSIIMAFFVVLSVLPFRVFAEAAEINAETEEDVLLYGDAAVQEDSSILLTQCQTWRAGSIWFKDPIDTTNGISVEFS